MKSFLTFLILLALNARAADEPLNLFADAHEITVQTAPTFQEGETISFRVSFAHRTLASGTTRAGGGTPGSAGVPPAEGVTRLPVALPGMKPGVALPLELTLSRPDGTQSETRKAWAFSDDPALLPAKKIVLFDRDEKTADALESLSIPFERGNSSPLATVETNTLILVGEDFSERETFNAILGAAERGADVLVLAPGRDTPLAVPKTIRHLRLGSAQEILRNPKAVYELALPEGGGLWLDAQDGAILLRADEHAALQAAQWNFTNGGRVRVCGASLIANWETTPAARWLLAEMLNTGEQP